MARRSITNVGMRPAIISTNTTTSEKELIEEYAWENRVPVGQVIYLILNNATKGFNDLGIIDEDMKLLKEKGEIRLFTSNPPIVDKCAAVLATS